VIGDSYINYVEQLNPRLAMRAIADGALRAGEEWRLYALPGASMASGGIAGFIPDQFALAHDEDADIRAVVMTGGGNDLLIADPFLGGSECTSNPMAATDAACKMVVQLAIDAAKALMVTAADAGVRDTVYFFYPHLPGGGFGGTHPNVMLDYAYPLAKATCDDAAALSKGRMRCHFIDLRPIFDGKPWIADDLIHPTAEGSEAIADEVWRVMKAQCIGQPASSGCCEP
jgi:hypothetical protein